MLTKLLKITSDFADAPTFSRSLQGLAKNMREVVEAEVSSVYLVVPGQRNFLFVANEGLNRNAVGEVTLGRNEGLISFVAERADPIHLDNARSPPRFHLVPEIGEELFNAFLGVPVYIIVGLLVCLFCRENRKNALMRVKKHF